MQTHELELALQRLSEFGLIRLGRVTGNYQTAYCPFHKGGKESRPSFGILLHDEVRNGQRYPIGWCHCFTCGTVHQTLPQMVTAILKTRSITQSGVEWLQQNVPGFVPDTVFEPLVPGELMEAVSAKFGVEYIQRQQGLQTTYVSEEELASYRFVVPYMYERKLTDELIEKFDVGYDANWVPPGRKNPVPCITFPVRDKAGHTLFICRRSIVGKLYNYPTGVSKPVYGVDVLPDGCKSVVICESIINAITGWKYGYPSVALLGTGNAMQIQQLKELGVSEFVICTDGDEAGHRAAEKLKRQLRSVALIWTISMPDGKDLNDCSKEEFDTLYAARE